MIRTATLAALPLLAAGQQPAATPGHPLLANGALGGLPMPPVALAHCSQPPGLFWVGAFDHDAREVRCGTERMTNGPGGWSSWSMFGFDVALPRHVTTARGVGDVVRAPATRPTRRSRRGCT